MDQGLWRPRLASNCPGAKTQPRNRKSVLVNLPLTRFLLYIKSRRVKPAGAKVAAWERKNKERGGSRYASWSISSVQRILLARPLLAGVITRTDPVPGSGVQRPAEKIFPQPSPVVSCGLQYVGVIPGSSASKRTHISVSICGYQVADVSHEQMSWDTASIPGLFYSSFYGVSALLNHFNVGAPGQKIVSAWSFLW